MELSSLRNTLREWFRTRKALVPLLAPLPLVVPNEGQSRGVNQTWMRFTVQTGRNTLVGVGTGVRRGRRLCRVFVEVFGEEAVGDGVVTEIAEAVEKVWRDAMVSTAAPHQDILVRMPESFERSETGVYCQVVSVPIEVDHIS